MGRLFNPDGIQVLDGTDNQYQSEAPAYEPNAIYSPLSATDITPSSASELQKGLIRGGANLKSGLADFGSILTNAVGATDATAALEKISKESVRSAQHFAPRISSLSEAKTPEDYFDFLVGGTAESLPFLATTVGTGGTAGLATKALGYGTKAVKAAQAGGAFASIAAPETGFTYREVQEKTGEKRPGLALAAGTIKGALDTYSLGKGLQTFLPKSLRHGIEKTVLQDIRNTAIREGTTEAAQELVDIGAVRSAKDKAVLDKLTPEEMQRVLDVASLGAVGGVAFAGAGRTVVKAAESLKSRFAPNESTEGKTPYEKIMTIMGKAPPEVQDAMARSFSFDSFEDMKNTMEANGVFNGTVVEDATEYSSLDEVGKAKAKDIFYKGGVPWPSVDLWAEAGTPKATDDLSDTLLQMHREDPESVSAYRAALKEGASREEALSAMQLMSKFEKKSALDLAKKRAAENDTDVEAEMQDLAEQVFSKWPKFREVANKIGIAKMLSDMHYIEQRESADVVPSDGIVELSQEELFGQGKQSVLQPEGYDSVTKKRRVASNQIPVKVTSNGETKTFGLDPFKLINNMLRKTTASDRGQTSAGRIAQAFHDGITSLAQHENIDASKVFDMISNMSVEEKSKVVLYRLKKTTDSKGRQVPGRVFTLHDIEQASKATPKGQLENAQAKYKKLQKVQKQMEQIAREATAAGVDAATYKTKRDEYKQFLKKYPRLDLQMNQVLEDIVRLKASQEAADITYEDTQDAFLSQHEISGAVEGQAGQPKRVGAIDRGYSVTDNPTSEAFFNFDIRNEIYEELSKTTSYRYTAEAAVDLYNSLIGLAEVVSTLSDSKSQDAAYMEKMYAKITKQKLAPVSKQTLQLELKNQITRAMAKASKATANEVEHVQVDTTVDKISKSSSQYFHDAEEYRIEADEASDTDWSLHEGFNYVVSQATRMAEQLGFADSVKVLTPSTIVKLLSAKDAASVLSGNTDGLVINANDFLEKLQKASETTGVPIKEVLDSIKNETGVDLQKGKYFLFVNPKMPKSLTLATTAHEMGHITLYEALEKGTLTHAIVSEYTAWLDHIKNNDPLVRELFKDRQQQAVQSLKTSLLNMKVSEYAVTEEGDRFIKYLTDFNEWFADRVRNRMLDPNPPKTTFERSLESIVNRLRTLFKLGVTAERTVEDFTDSLMKRSKSRAWNSPQNPHEVLTTWQDTIRHARNATMSESERAEFDKTLFAMIDQFTRRTLGLKLTQFEAEFLQDLVSMQKDDALGAAFNKSIRFGFEMLLSTEERKILANATNSNYVKAQVSKLLRNSPEAWAEASSNEEAMMAYAYQFWITGQVQLGKKPHGIFQKIYDFLKDLLGVTLDSENAEMLFNEFTTGNALLRMQGNSEANFYVKEAARDTMVRRAVHDYLAPAWSKVADSKFGYSFFSAASQRMYQTKNAALIKLANTVYAKIGTQFEGQDMLTQRTEMIGRFTNRAYLIYEGKDKAFGENVIKILNEGREFTRAEKQTSGAAFAALTDEEQAAVRTQLLMTEMYRYMKDAGLPIGFQENYFPWVFNEEYIRDNYDSFVQLLSSPEYEMEISQMGLTPSELADFIISNRGYADNVVSTDDLGHTPAMSAMHSRTLAFLDKNATPAQRAELAKFFSKNLGHTLNTYIEQSVKRTEFHRRFGDGKLDNIMSRAKRQGASAKDMEVAKTYMDAVMGIHGYETNRALAKLLGMDPPNPGQIINPKLQRAMGLMMVYQSVRVLALSTLTSIVDPIGIAVRTGDVGIAWKSFTEGVRASVSHARGNKEVMVDMAEMLGVIDRHMTVEALNWEYGGIYIQGTARKVNEKFFQYIGLQAWTRATRIMGMEAGLRFIARHTVNPNEHSERFLGELNLRPEDVIVGKDGKVKILTAAERRASTPEEVARDDKVRTALHRFVDGAILRPNATLRPIWASDPHFMLFFHLKSFMYSFHERILKRVVLEAANNNLMPLLMFGMFIPFMIAGDMLRDLIQHPGGNPQKAQWGMMEYIYEAMNRSGMLGLGQIASDAGRDRKYGGFGYESFAGPSVQQVHDILLKDDYKALDALPAQNIYKYWTEQ